jgi:hypothetical protein
MYAHTGLRQSPVVDLEARWSRHAVHERCILLGDMLDVLTPAQGRSFDEILEALLKSMVKAAQDADHICRLCDGEECPAERCPVHQRAVALDAA